MKKHYMKKILISITLVTIPIFGYVAAFGTEAIQTNNKPII